MNEYSLANSSPSVVHLSLLRETLAGEPYPGYPRHEERFFAALLGQAACGLLTVPEAGPWNVHIHPNRPDHERLPTDAVQQRLLAEGYRLDTIGRPMHPWLEAMATDPDIGLVGGKGAYWQWGPNRTADALVVHGDRLLLVRRHDTGLWAVPGGFCDDEPASTTALRELHEETGLELTHGTYHARILYNGPVADPRLTAHAWPETTAILHAIEPTDIPPAVAAGDDAAEAVWVPFADLTHYRMFGSHRWLAQLALEHTDHS